jgi:DNA-binding SARP family transcriptional activator
MLLHANQVVSTDDLIDRLWGERAPPTAAKVLQVQVSHLRKALGRGGLLTRPPGYLMRIGADELDLARFERLVAESRGAESAVAAQTLREALALWRGPALADFAYESFAATAIARLEELRLVAHEERVEADLALGRHVEVVPELELLAAANPLRERLRGELMLALYRSGRQAEALDVYRRTRELLADELGLEPGPALQDLQCAILAHAPSLDAPDTGTTVVPARAILLAALAPPPPALLSLAARRAPRPPLAGWRLAPPRSRRRPPAPTSSDSLLHRTSIWC